MKEHRRGVRFRYSLVLIPSVIALHFHFSKQHNRQLLACFFALAFLHFQSFSRLFPLTTFFFITIILYTGQHLIAVIGPDNQLKACINTRRIYYPNTVLSSFSFHVIAVYSKISRETDGQIVACRSYMNDRLPLDIDCLCQACPYTRAEDVDRSICSNGRSTSVFVRHRRIGRSVGMKMTDILDRIG